MDTSEGTPKSLLMMLIILVPILRCHCHSVIVLVKGWFLRGLLLLVRDLILACLSLPLTTLPESKSFLVSCSILFTL